ncbi:MAG: chorismate mutase, partial [Acidobacteriota bacterium]
MKRLTRLRRDIDRADEALIEALAQRMDRVRRIARVKAALGRAVLDPERERQVLAAAAQRAMARGLTPEAAQRVLREVMAVSRQWQARCGTESGAAPRVAYQGAAGAFSWIAARTHFGGQLEPIGFATFAETLQAVATGSVEHAVVPVENTLVGSIHEVLDELAGRDLHVVGEEVVRIEHCLVALAPLPLERIRLVLSHPVALAQCSRFLRSLPGAQCRAWVDTAEAVDRVRLDGVPEHVAVASREAAELRNLAVIATDIADHRENFTRFWVIGRHPRQGCGEGPPCTSLLLVTDHRRGALVEVLHTFASRGFNLTRLESRPIRGIPWQYAFFIDLEGDLADPDLAAALDEARGHARVVRILGCYPRSLFPGGASVDGGVQPHPATPPPEPSPPRTTCQVRANATAPLGSLSRYPERTVIRVGNVEVGAPGTFVVMAGPCAVESATQIEAAARLVRSTGGVVLRGGAFKPRTSPYTFQGLG